MRANNYYQICVFLLVIVLGTTGWVTVAAATDSTSLDEATIKAYLEKKVAADPGSCLVENIKLNIIGIADLVQGSQTEVFYDYEYRLRCNQGSQTKQGKGVLNAVRLRNGKWIDRETVGMISQ